MPRHGRARLPPSRTYRDDDDAPRLCRSLALPIHHGLPMQSHKLAVKFFAGQGADIPVEDFVPVFHRWIQGKLLNGHQLIDVADYGHVHQGPGTVLVSHEANIHIDLTDGKPGLLYIRKQPGAGNTFRERLRATFAAALQCAALLEAEAALPHGGIRFRTEGPLFLINDRLHAPNTPETFAGVRGELEAFLNNLYAAKVELAYAFHPERLFQVQVKAPAGVSVNSLLGRAATA